MFDRIMFVIGEALIALRRNGSMTVSAISTVAIALYLMGGLGFAYRKAVDYADTLPGRFETRVFLKDGVKTKSISDTATKIRAIPGVAGVSWIPKDKAWAKFKQDNPKLTQGMDIDNPFMDSFKVTLKDLNLSHDVERQIAQISTVRPEDGVQSLGPQQDLIEQLVIKPLGWLSYAGALLLLISGILIFNTIRLAIISRRTEIRIMQLVGASRLTMGIPFLIEGILQGVVGGVLAGAFVWLSYQTLQSQIRLAFAPNWAPFPGTYMITVLGGIGAAFGALCSMLALQWRPKA